MVPPLARGARGFPLPSRITTVGTPLSCRARVPILWNTPSHVGRVLFYADKSDKLPYTPPRTWGAYSMKGRPRRRKEAAGARNRGGYCHSWQRLGGMQGQGTRL